MIRKKLFYNIHYADYACISGTPPQWLRLCKPFCLLRPACGSDYSILLYKNMKITASWRLSSHESPFLITRKNESIIMICSLPLLLNHPPITVEIPACWVCYYRVETALFKKFSKPLSQKMSMNLPKNHLFKTSDCFHSLYPPTAVWRHAENASQWHAENASDWARLGVALVRAVLLGESLYFYSPLAPSKWHPPRGFWLQT